MDKEESVDISHLLIEFIRHRYSEIIQKGIDFRPIIISMDNDNLHKDMKINLLQRFLSY